jgi:ADP-ribose pyrophosphatase
VRFIKKKKLVFKNQVYKAYSNYIKSKHYIIKDYLTLEVVGKKIGGVCCIILNKKKIGLMKVYSPILNQYLYSLVQGFCDKKEKPLTAVKREIIEETGFKIKKENIKFLTKILPMHSLINSKLAIYYSFLERLNLSDFKLRQKEIGTGKMYFFDLKQINKMLEKPYKFDLISYAVISYFLFKNKTF